MNLSLRRAAGSLLVVGISGKELTAMERAWLRLMRPAGIILYKRNIADARQTRALLTEATAFCPTHCVRTVDVEGGTVNRLNEALGPIPSAQAVAQAMRRPTLSQKARKDGAPDSQSTLSRKTREGEKPSDLAREHGELIARAVAAFGFNCSLAPMVDLALADSAEVLGTRCPAPTAQGVVEYARGFLAGLASRGVVGCGKHFPGLGGGTRDSHLETPAIERDGKAIWREDLEPYRALHKEMPMVMVNHAAYPMTPGKDRPASVSKYWIETILRGHIGYKGIVLSDDLEMGGIVKFMPIEEAAVEALRTGSDLIEVCHHAEPILCAFEALIAEAERSAAFAKLLMARARETARKRERVFPNAVPPALSAAQFEALRARIVRFGETIVEAQPATGATGA
ncbi:MAG: glycoside hydrolase family 3 N-terminal domain-containing protein [Terracidiphilus sp.]